MEHPEWIGRRVEKIQVVDVDHRERSISLDIDARKLRARAQQHSVESTSISIPLTVIPKGLLLDFDLHDSSGSSISVINRDEDSLIAEQIVCAMIYRHLGLMPADLPHAIRQRIRGVIHSFPQDDDGLSGSIFETEEPTTTESHLNDADEALWLKIKSNRAVSKILDQFATNFILAARTLNDDDRLVLKYRRLENERDANVDLLSKPIAKHWFSPKKWPFYPRKPSYPVVLRAQNIGRAAREHLRVVAPQGTFVAFALLVAVPRSDDDPVVLNYASRVTTERAIFYTKGASPGEHYVVAALLPDLRGFSAPILWFSSASTLLLLLGSLSNLLWGFVDNLRDTLDPAVTLLILIPTLLLAYMTRDNEHPARRRLLTRLRVIALCSLIPLVVATLVLFVKVELFQGWVVGTVWFSCGIAAAVLTVWFAILTLRITRERKFIEENGTRTTDWTFRVLVD